MISFSTQESVLAERGGLAGTALDWDRMVADSSLTAGGVTLLCP